ncbi:MAG TPA: ABC transporter permease subunit [Verrucomicrobiales bacterium]|nr:ABC transporter permease subunit [Verrucomicrobiales bacterium]
MSAFSNIVTILKKELRSYFNSPLAYVLIVIFLLAAQGFAFLFGGVFERQEASLTESFFFWHPWLFMVLAPALGMRLWSEEQRLGTMELLLTMPVAPWHAIVGKFLAASVIIFLALALTFPIWMTISYLGKPDHGVIFAGYCASFLLGTSFLAVTSAVSAFTRSQVVAFVIAVAVCLLLILAGFPPVVQFLNEFRFGEMVAAFGVLTHFNELAKGILVLRDVFFFLSVTGFCLYFTAVVLKSKRA